MILIYPPHDDLIVRRRRCLICDLASALFSIALLAGLVLLAAAGS